MANENDLIQAFLDKDEWRARLIVGAPYPERPRPEEDPGKTPEERAAYWIGELRFLFAMENFDEACTVVKSIDAATPRAALDTLRALHANYLRAEETAYLRAHAEAHPRIERAFAGAEEELGELLNRRIAEAVRNLKLPGI